MVIFVIWKGRGDSFFLINCNKRELLIMTQHTVALIDVTFFFFN